MGVIALIPARGGSKGIPRKNIRLVAGRPLIAWTIDAALEARRVDRVVVSTDDEEIRDISLALGAEAPFLRPSTIAADESSSMEVVRHAVETLDMKTLVYLQPTSPLRTSDDIDAALFIHQESGMSVISVAKVKPWLFELDEGSMLHSIGKISDTRQQGSQVYAPNGAIYIASASRIASGGSWWDAARAYVMASSVSVDIDEPYELMFAELMLNKRIQGS